MPTYRYRAKNGPTDIKEGDIEAGTEAEAIEDLNQMGYLPISIVPRSGASESRLFASGRLGGNVRSKDITVFSRQLASLLKSGVPILRALNIISEQSENPALRSVIGSIHDSVKEGVPFSSTTEIDRLEILSPMACKLPFSSSATM